MKESGPPRSRQGPTLEVHWIFGRCRGDDIFDVEGISFERLGTSRLQWALTVHTTAVTFIVYHVRGPGDGDPAGAARGSCIPPAVAWNGQQVIVWGGVDNVSDGRPMNTGYALDRSTGEKVALPIQGAPSARQGALAVWTGEELLLWGGHAAGWLNGPVYSLR